MSKIEIVLKHYSKNYLKKEFDYKIYKKLSNYEKIIILQEIQENPSWLHTRLDYVCFIIYYYNKIK